MRKTILILASMFMGASFTLTPYSPAYAQSQYAQQPYARQSAGPNLDQLKAKGFTVRTLDGQNVSLNSLLENGKPILIDFWATWCGPCRMVIPHMSELYKKYGKDGLIVIGMNLEDSRQGPAVKTFVKRNGMNYKNVFAPNSIYQFFSGAASARIPFTLLFGSDGSLIWRQVGYSPQLGSILSGAIAKTLAAHPNSTDQATPDNSTDQATPDNSTDQATPDNSTEDATPGKLPDEPVAPENQPEPPVLKRRTDGRLHPPSDQAAPGNSTEPSTPANPGEHAAPESKGNCHCDCPCCSPSRSSDKQTEQNSPANPAARREL